MSRWRSNLRRVWAVAPVLLALSCLCAAQTTGNSAGNSSNGKTSPPCQPAASKPCPPAADTKKQPSAAEQFPYPGESQDTDIPAAPNAPVPDAPQQHRDAGKQFPYPGETPPPEPGQGNSSSNSSSSSSSSSADDTPEPSAPDDAAPADGKDGKRGPLGRLGRRKLPVVPNPQSDEERAAEDLRVAKFYEQSGNLYAAYLRAKDAVQVQPDDPDMHFALAHIAQKMNNRDEAIAEYKAYLKLDPDGVQIKQAKKALEQLQR